MMGDFVKLVKLWEARRECQVWEEEWYDMVPPLGFFCLFSLLGGLTSSW